MGCLSVSLNHFQFPLLMFYSFQHINRSPHWYFISGVVILKDIISLHLHPFSDISLLVQRNATYFCMLIFYPATLLNSFISFSSSWWSLGFSIYIESCHLHVMTVLPLPFQLGYFLFFFFSDYCG